MEKLDLMLEADRRGLLPPDKKAMLAEAISRGLVSAPDGGSPGAPVDADLAKWSKPEKPSALVRVGRGMADVTEGIGQGARMVADFFSPREQTLSGLVKGGAPVSRADEYTKARDAEIAAYERGRGPDAGMDWWRLGGNVAATLPVMAIPGAGAATLAGRGAAGAVQGAAASGLMYTPEEDSKGAQVALGGILGAAAPAVVQGVKNAGGRVLDMIRPQVNVTLNPAAQQALTGELTLKLQQQGIDFGKLTSDVRSSLLADAQKALSAGGTLDDAMLANKALIEQVGAKPTRASLSRAPRDWQEEKNLRGIVGAGEGIVERDQANATALTDYLGKLRAQTGGKATTALEAGEAPIKALQAADAAKEKVVDDLYKVYRESGQQFARVPQGKLTESLGKVIDEVGIDSLPPSVTSRLKDFGFLGGDVKRNLTIQEADQFNRLLNNNNPGHGPASKAIGMLKGALNQSLLDVPQAAGEGAEKLIAARAAAAQRFAEQDAGKGITAALDDVSPDRFVKKFIYDADVRDVRAMKAELLKTPDGEQALKDVKGHLLDNLLMKSTGATAVDDVVGKPFSGVKFSKALDAIPPEKLHLLFTPDEIGAMRTLQKASKLLTEEVPFSDVNHSKTAAALANILQKIGQTPMLGALVSPIIGAGKIGMDWVKNAADRKMVAEVLLGSAGKAGGPAALAAPGRVVQALPGAAGASLNQPSKRTDD